MQKPVLSLVVGGVVIACALLAYHFSAEQVYKRRVQSALTSLGSTVATGDRAQIASALTGLLTEDATIHLSVHFFSIGNTRPVLAQDFNPSSFVQFIDHTLYPLTAYHYAPTLESLDAESGRVVVTAQQWGDGAAPMGGVAVDMRYSASSRCEGEIVEGVGESLRLRTLSCEIQFRQVPKPGQEGKILQKRNLMELLGKE